MYKFIAFSSLASSSCLLAKYWQTHSLFLFLPFGVAALFLFRVFLSNTRSQDQTHPSSIHSVQTHPPFTRRIPPKEKRLLLNWLKQMLLHFVGAVTSWSYTGNTYRKIVLLTLSYRKCFVCLFWNDQKYPRVHIMTFTGVKICCRSKDNLFEAARKSLKDIAIIGEDGCVPSSHGTAPSTAPTI